MRRAVRGARCAVALSESLFGFTSFIWMRGGGEVPARVMQSLGSRSQELLLGLFSCGRL